MSDEARNGPGTHLSITSPINRRSASQWLTSESPGTKEMLVIPTDQRLEREAVFQDSRESQTKEPRDRLAYLISDAVELYNARVFQCVEDLKRKVDTPRAVVPGCATGMVTPLARRGVSVLGVDISPLAVEKLGAAVARANLNPLARVECGNAEELPVEQDSLDLICCSGVLHHLDIQLAIENWFKALKTGGRLVMLEPLAYNPIVAAYRRLTPGQHSPDEHPLTRDDVRLLHATFTSVNVKPVNLTTVVTAPLALARMPSTVINRLHQPLRLLDRVLLGRLAWLDLMAWSVVIDCEK